MKVKAARINLATQEPMGIVISRGPSQEEPPRLSAYVWGPAPEPTDNSGKPQAA
jgi:hypothetical protein